MRYVYEVLNEEEIMRIHETSLRVLKNIGMKVYDNSICTMMSKKGLIVDADQQLIKFPSDMVNAAIKSAPETFTMYDHRGNKEVVETGSSLPANYANAISIWDWHTKKLRKATVQDVTVMMQLTQAIPELKIACPMCFPSDSPVESKILHAITITLRNCIKINEAAPHNLAETIFWIESLAIAQQGQSLNPRDSLLVALSPTNPLQIDPNTCESFHYTAEHNYPLLISSCPMAGATSPITMAGTTVLTHAEQLGMITIAQLISEGCPCIYGGASGSIDMRNGQLTYGCGERLTMLSANLDIAKHFKLPHFSAAGSVDTPEPDFQAAISKSFNSLARLMNGVSLGIWFGCLLTGKAVSPEQMILDQDIYRQAQSLLNGIIVEEERLAYDAIERVGPAGNFLTDEHTLKYMRDEDEFYPSPIVNHNGEHGKNMIDRAHDRVEEIIRDFQSPVPENIQQELENFLIDYTKASK